MPRRFRPLPRRRILRFKQVEKIRRLQTCRAIRRSPLIDQQGKGNATILAKHARVIAIAQPNRGHIDAFFTKGALLRAQLRDVLAAENSTVVAQEHNHRRLSFPQRTQSDLAPVGIRQRNRRERFGE